MSNITTFKFNETGFKELKKHHRGIDWPVVYIIENNKEAYVGETTSAFNRSKQHYDNPARKGLKNIHIITDNSYNKSAALDLESSLIQYMSADGARVLQNANGGLKNHSYYDREAYQSKFDDIWEKLKERDIVNTDLLTIENSDLFKYSPYKALTEEQATFVKKIFTDIQNEKSKTYIVNGQPGTGKTVLATYLVKYLKEHKDTKHLKIALVIPMGSLRATIKRVFSNIKGLSAGMVVIANDVAREDYDLVIVDEAHRLKRRKNLGAAFKAFDDINKMLKLDKEATHVDWIIKKSKQQVFFYDKNQNVVPADVGHKQFDELKNVTEYNLSTQLRITAGEKYIKFIEDLLKGVDNQIGFGNHDLKIYDDACEMVDAIKEKNEIFELCRIVAGYAWPWTTKPGKDSSVDYDIRIDDCKLKWNSTAVDWVNSPNAINEVGCIHTIQGYDLNYVGVIIGPELKYNKETKSMYIDRAEYHDRNGRAGVTDDEQLKRYIINIYKTLLTRGIKGAYIYVVDNNLREYFKQSIPVVSTSKVEIQEVSLGESLLNKVDKAIETVMIPVLGSAPCGVPFWGEENKETEIAVDKRKIKSGEDKYFILHAEGDSMNLAGIQDGDLVLCRAHQKAYTGQKAIVLLGDDVTIKYYDKKDGRRILLPKSNNPIHQPIIPEEGSSVLGTVQEVLDVE